MKKQFSGSDPRFKYEFEIIEYPAGTFIWIDTLEEWDNCRARFCASRKIIDNKIVWGPINDSGYKVLRLTPEIMDYADRLVKLKSFW